MLTDTTTVHQPSAPSTLADCPTCGGTRYLEGAPHFTPCPDCCVCPTCGGLLGRPANDQGCTCGQAEIRAVRRASHQS
jgi:hypothetical protein